MRSKILADTLATYLLFKLAPKYFLKITVLFLPKVCSFSADG